MKINLPSPKELLARKGAEKERVDKKPKRKALTKRKEPAKAIVPESNIEPELTKEEENTKPPRRFLMGWFERLVPRVVGEYERTTLKARYELLKEYKQGLLVDTNVEEEIELFEESITEADVQTSAPITSFEQVATAASTIVNGTKLIGIKPPTVDEPRSDPPE
ncbi:hypothetical protein TIFTF001_043900 [Ficus carica]|uniref:Uncharacterized protein n=1 Tax=Ficus carica TaxID=3494 RepID=A0AA87YXS8_FICCA|nr:hypothetical protein TIFTF001_043900 [Ficus carica]